MLTKNIYTTFKEAELLKKKLLAILIDPEKFQLASAAKFLRNLPSDTTHIFVGGSTVNAGETEAVVKTLKLYTAKPIIIFPGDHSQITDSADAILFLSLLSGRNPEYLIGQQVQSVTKLRSMDLEVIPTGYVLIDGGNDSAVARVTGTVPLLQDNVQLIVDTAKAGAFMGAQLIYLEAGSGAKIAVSELIIRQVKKDITIPLIVGGGIRTIAAKEAAYAAGADMVVMGTVYENIYDMNISVELTLTPLQDNFEPPIIDFIKSLRSTGLTVLENPLSTQVFGDYDTVMGVLNKEIKTALQAMENGLLYMKIVTSNRSNYEPHF